MNQHHKYDSRVSSAKRDRRPWLLFDLSRKMFDPSILYKSNIEIVVMSDEETGAIEKMHLVYDMVGDTHKTIIGQAYTQHEARQMVLLLLELSEQEFDQEKTEKWIETVDRLPARGRSFHAMQARKAVKLALADPLTSSEIFPGLRTWNGTLPPNFTSYHGPRDEFGNPFIS